MQFQLSYATRNSGCGTAPGVASRPQVQLSRANSGVEMRGKTASRSERAQLARQAQRRDRPVDAIENLEVGRRSRRLDTRGLERIRERVDGGVDSSSDDSLSP